MKVLRAKFLPQRDLLSSLLLKEHVGVFWLWTDQFSSSVIQTGIKHLVGINSVWRWHAFCLFVCYNSLIFIKVKSVFYYEEQKDWGSKHISNHCCTQRRSRLCSTIPTSCMCHFLFGDIKYFQLPTRTQTISPGCLFIWFFLLKKCLIL